MEFEIKELHTRTELRRFVDFPHHLYAGNPYWVPSLRMSELDTLDWHVNPAFEHCRARYWIAESAGRIVGRIAAIINPKHEEVWGQPYMRFGWFDVVDDFDVTQALLDQVESWAQEEKKAAVHGPLGFTNMDHTGLLIDGFDELATMAAGYNYPYYQDLVERAGFKKDVDTVDYQMTMSDGINPKIEKLAGIVQKRFGLRLLNVKNKKELIPYAHELFDLLGEEYQHLYAVVPLTDPQVDAYIDQYFGFISPEFVPVVVDENDKMVAFGITIPSLAKALQKAKGRLFPFGFLHLMGAMKKNDTAELMLVAVAKEYQGKGVNALLITHIFKVFQEFGIRIAESNPELENNLAVQAQWKHFNRRQHKRRRIYIKHL